MKYGFILILIIVVSFGGTCFGAIRMSYNYLNLETPNACCSYHDGVAYRDFSGHYVCNDGVVNYTCKR